MKKMLLFALAMLLFASHCLSAGYTQKLLVQVFDQDYRPVEGAQVYVEHQVNSVVGDAKTKPVSTKANGTADISFTDWEELSGQTKYTYTLYTKYGSEVESAVLTVTDTSAVRVYSMQVKAHYAFVSVHDQKGKPLAASVTVGNTTRKTDVGGMARFQLPPGKYTAKAEINGAVRNRDLSLDKDQNIEIEFPLYTVKITVIDDYKRPLAAQVDLDGAAKNTSADGIAVFENVSNEQPKVTVRYNESFRKLQPNLKQESSMLVVFDLTKPVIQELHHSIQKNGEAVINAYVQEPGASASGISGVSITYEVGGVTTSVPAYTVGYNSFEAKIPVVPRETLVKYTVKATDKAGNAGFASGTYTIALERKNVELKKDNGFFGITLGWETIVVGLVAFGIVGYGVLYYRKRQQHEKDLEDEIGVEVPPQSPYSQPPVNPPTLPPQA